MLEGGFEVESLIVQVFRVGDFLDVSKSAVLNQQRASASDVFNVASEDNGVLKMSTLRASKTAEAVIYVSSYSDVRNVKGNGQTRQTSGRSVARHDGELSDDSDEGGNGSDERENEFENLDLMSAMARRPLTNTDEGERDNQDKRLGSRCID